MYSRGSHFVGRDYSHAVVGVNIQTAIVRRIFAAIFPGHLRSSSDGSAIAFISNTRIVRLELATRGTGTSRPYPPTPRP